MRVVGRYRGDPPGRHDAPPRRRAGAALVRMAPMDDRSRAVQLGLQKSLVGVVADGIRHQAVAVGNHAVRRDDGVSFDAVRSNHRQTIAGAAT